MSAQPVFRYVTIVDQVNESHIYYVPANAVSLSNEVDEICQEDSIDVKHWYEIDRFGLTLETGECSGNIENTRKNDRVSSEYGIKLEDCVNIDIFKTFF